MNTLKLKNITHNYFGGERPTLNSVSATFESGLNCIFGLSESGKSTLAKVICGIEKFEGEIFLNDNPIATSIKEKDISALLWDMGLKKHRTGNYNLIYPLKIRKVPPVEANAKCQTIARFFSIGGAILENTPFHLSKGENARLALARAFIRESKIKVFDNPFAGLPSTERRELFDLFIKACSMYPDCIIIYATDDIDEACCAKNKILFLSDGYALAQDYFINLETKPPHIDIKKSFCPFGSIYPVKLTADCNFILHTENPNLEEDEEYIPIFANSFKFKGKLIDDSYLGRIVNAFITPCRVIQREDGIKFEVKGFLRKGKEGFVLLENENNYLYIKDTGEMKIGDLISIAITSPYLFDMVNGRSILNYEEN